jgi:hypothetical protein
VGIFYLPENDSSNRWITGSIKKLRIERLRVTISPVAAMSGIKINIFF